MPFNDEIEQLREIARNKFIENQIDEGISFFIDKADESNSLEVSSYSTILAARFQSFKGHYQSSNSTLEKLNLTQSKGLDYVKNLGLANNYFYLGLFKKSIELLKKLSELDSPNPLFVFDRLILEAKLAAKRSDYRTAIGKNIEALNVLPEGKKYFHVKAKTYNSIAVIYKDIYNFKLSEAFFNKAKTLFESSDLVTTHFEIGNYEGDYVAFLLSKNRTKKREKFPESVKVKVLKGLQKADKLSSNISKLQARNCRNYGVYYRKIEEYEKAINSFKKEVEFRRSTDGKVGHRPNVAKALNCIARTFIWEGEKKQNIKYFFDAIPFIHNAFSELLDNPSISASPLQDNPNIDFENDSLIIHSELELSYSLYLKAKACLKIYQLGKKEFLDTAYDSIKKAIVLIGKNEQEYGFLDILIRRVRKIYDFAMEIYFEIFKLKETTKYSLTIDENIFELLQAFRATILMSQIRNEAPVEIEDYEYLTFIGKKMLELNNLPEFSFKKKQPNSGRKSQFNLNSFQKELNKDEVVISYFDTEENIFGIIISNDFLDVKKLKCKNNQIEGFRDTLSRLGNCLKSGNVENMDIAKKSDFLICFSIASENDEQHLIKILDLDERFKKVYIIPDGCINNLPVEILSRNPVDADKFELAVDKEIEPKDFFKNINFYVKEDIVYCYNYSISLLYQNKQFENNQTMKEQKFLGIYGKILDKKDEKMFKESVDEVTECLNLDTVNCQIKDSLADKLKDATIVYIITHSTTEKIELYGKTPGVILEEGQNKITKFITAESFREMDLSNIDLFVLLCCGGEEGEPFAGEGPLNLGRALIEGGAKNIVFTIGDIDLNKAKMLVYYFFEEIRKGIPYAEALAEAKKRFIYNLESPNPIDWAKLVFYGSQNAKLF